MINNPTEITDCVLWLDGDDEASLTLETLSQEEIDILSSWGVSYSQEQKAVNVWQDKSISNLDIVMTTTERPKYVPNSINGRGTLRFDGNDAFWVPDDLFDYSNMSMFIVGECYDADRPRSVIMTNVGSNKDLLRITVETAEETGSQFRLEAGREGGDDFVNSYFPAYENQTFVYSLQSLKGFLEGRINGMSAGVARTACSGSIKGLKVGTGKSRWQREGIRGFVGEFIIYNRALNEQELQDMFGYLFNKWGIESNPSV